MHPDIFKNIHSSGDNTNSKFSFNGSIDAGSNYNVAKTTTFFRATHEEGGSNGAIAYQTGADLAQGTGDQLLADQVGSDADQCVSGFLHLFNPLVKKRE